MHTLLRRSVVALGLILLAGSLSACIIEEPGRPRGGWCYWHPGACR
jgi:hypothetical protein